MRLLSGQLDRVTNQLHSQGSKSSSVPDLTSSAGLVFDFVEDLLSQVLEISKAKMNKTKTARQCHHCHRLLSHPEHAGVGSGINLCSLPHYELCPGGRTGPDWTGCPDDSFDESSDEEDIAGVEQTAAAALSKAEGDDAVNLKEDNVLENNKMNISNPTLNPYAVAKSLLEAASKAEQVVLDHDSDSSDDEEEKILQSEIEKLRLQVTLDEDTKKKAEKKERKRLNRERLEKEKADLLRKSKLLQTVPPIVKVTESRDNSSADNLHKKSADFAAKQQQEAADRRAALQAGSGNLTIGNIRSQPGNASEVERLLAGLQALVPSIARAPTAPSKSGPTFQPSGVLSNAGDEYDTDYVFHPGRGKFVPVVHSPARGKAAHNIQHKLSFEGVRHEQEDEGETSADEDCPIEPPPGYKLVWKRDSLGEKYFLQKKAKQSKRPEMIETYVCDEETGRWYKRQIPKSDLDRNQGASSTSNRNFQKSTTPSYSDHRRGSPSPVPLVQRGYRTPAATGPAVTGDRIPGIVPIESEKQGRDHKVPDRIQWAKNCPVNWTDKVSPANINVVLWAWSYITEILATRTGMAPNLEHGELEARLEHFCNVLEITLQTSGQADFGGDSWAVGRLYDKKVQQKVDSGMFSWVKLSDMNHGASMPHELIAATQELARKPKVDDRRGAGDGKKGAGDGTGKGGKKDSSTRPFKCPTWNKSVPPPTMRGKCTWEVENAHDKCQGIHECSWCKSKSYTPLNHLRHFCQKRLGEEEE